MSNCYSADAHFVQVATEVRTAACESILSTCIYARGNLTQDTMLTCSLQLKSFIETIHCTTEERMKEPFLPQFHYY